MQHPSETKQHLPHLFLGEVVKINSAGKAEVRTCIITSEFLYTCRPGQHTHFRRRISLEGISKLLLVPSTSDVLVIVPEEYDLRICVNENLDEFISVLKLAFKEQRKTSLEVEIVDEEILLNTIKSSTFWTKSTKNKRVSVTQRTETSQLQVLHSTMVRLVALCNSLVSTFTTQWSSVHNLPNTDVTKTIFDGMGEAHRLICVAMKEIIKGRNFFEQTIDQHGNLFPGSNESADRKAKVQHIINNVYHSVISCSWTCVASSWSCHKYLMQDRWKRSTFTTSVGVPNLQNSIPMETRACTEALQVFQSSAKQLLGGAIELHGQHADKTQEGEDIQTIQHTLDLLTQAQATMELNVDVIS